MNDIRQSSLVLVGCMVLLVLCGSAWAGHAYTWTGGNGTSLLWSTTSNWSGNTGHYPGEDATDTAYIPSVENGNYPEFDFTVGKTIAELKLEMTYRYYDHPKLKFQNPGDPNARSLTVAGKHGLSVGKDCEIVLEKRCGLVLEKSGRVLLDGHIVFGESADNPSPYVALPTGATVLTGSGYLIGKERGIIKSAGQTTKTVLVVGENNKLYGGLRVYVVLVNNGLVDVNGAPETGNGFTPYGKTLSLTCAPKMGSGDWKITGGEADEGEIIKHNFLIVSADVTGTGDLTIGSYGVLTLTRNWSTSGKFTQDPLGEHIVSQFVLFDVHRFAKVCDGGS